MLGALRFLFATGWVIAAFAAAAQTFVVPPELWDRPRSGKAVLEQPAVRQAVNVLLAQPGARLVVRHGPEPESLHAAEELRLWLSALAIEPPRIALRNDLKPSEPLQMEVVRER